MSQPTNYTGHGARTGGLQAHSVGALMPYTVIGVGNHFAAMDTRTGNIGRPQRTYHEAEMDVHSIRIRNMMHS